jgi:hypothetical protein
MPRVTQRSRVDSTRLSGQEVWRELAKTSFLAISCVTPAGEPRSAGVVYTTGGALHDAARHR